MHVFGADGGMTQYDLLVDVCPLLAFGNIIQMM